MSLRSSVLVFLVGCVPVYDPIVICHNGNCDGSGAYLDDSMDGLAASLAVTYRGKPAFDGVEIDTFMFATKFSDPGQCLFAHDAIDPSGAATPNDAAALVAEHLTHPSVAWNEERFYLKIELKPTVAGQNDFHSSAQSIRHVQCVLEMIEVATKDTTWPVTVLIDSTSECLHGDFDVERANAPISNPLVTIEHSGPVVPVRFCQRFNPKIHTFFVRDWRDTEIEAIRPAMVWMDRRSENTETVKIIRHIRPEYVTTSAVPYVRGWIEGYR